jgi:hypothetical protein
MVRTCVEFDTPIEENSLSLEQILINDQDFCRKCFDSIMLAEESISYLERPAFLSLA